MQVFLGISTKSVGRPRCVLVLTETTVAALFPGNLQALYPGVWSPNKFGDGGTIYLDRKATGFYPNERVAGLPVGGEPNTHGTLLAHELGHAISHVRREKGADQSRPSSSIRSRLEGRAISRANMVHPRLGKPLDTRRR